MECSVYRSAAAAHRCVCPYGTWGARCKILDRHFTGGPDGGGGWAWVPSLPSCSEMHISLEVLTRSGDATLLYSGPDRLSPVTGDNSEVMMLELRDGRPNLLLELGAGPVTLNLNTSYSLADHTWHRLDLIWRNEVRQLIRHQERIQTTLGGVKFAQKCLTLSYRIKSQ